MAAQKQSSGPGRFVVRLEATDGSVQEDGTPHFRETSMVAESAEAAQAHCEQKEREVCAWQLPAVDHAAIRDEQEKAEAAGGELRGRSKGRLAAHHQVEPYKVVSVREVGA